jgi:tRNA threonylcarbamoyladenosine biosynthesis protein TsaE
MLTAATSSVDETRALGRALAGLVRQGDIVLLAGDLGAGKTAFTQGLGAGLGIDEPITSPTFIIARTYDGPTRLHHLDVYRLDRVQEAIDVGLPEMVDDGAVTVIEWGDAVVPALPREFLEVRLRFGDGDDDRRFELRTVGSRWSARGEALRKALAPWGDEC